MKYFGFFLLLFLIFWACDHNKAIPKNWVISLVKNLPVRTSNQAVSEGFINNKPYLYSFGGLDSTKLYSGIHQRSFRFDIIENTWEEISSLPDSLGKIANAASRINDTIYIIGGYHVFKDGTERSSNKIHRFDIKQNKFINDGKSIPIPIDDHVQVVWRNKFIYIITGWSDSENVPNVQIYDPKKNTWFEGTSVPNNHIYKSFGASGAIVGDTIYYFGGASMGKNYPIQNYLRKGVINANDPSKISWTYEVIDSLLNGYRMSSINIDNIPYWIGGSTNTYNYNGIAYDKSGGVSPNKRILSLENGKFNLNFNENIPMDLRGITDIDLHTKFLIGGMGKDQKVSNQVIRIEWK